MPPASYNEWGQQIGGGAGRGFAGSGAGGSTFQSQPFNTVGSNIWNDPTVQSGFYNNREQFAKQQEDRKNKQNIANIQYQKGQDQDYSSMMNTFNLDPTSVSFGQRNQFMPKRKDDPDKPSWASKMMGQVGDMGIKDWGNLAVRGMEAYTGWKELGQAEDQHKLALDTFEFQKAAWNKDREGRVLAYNTNAQNVNAWKAAQGRTDLNKLMV